MEVYAECYCDSVHGFLREEVSETVRKNYEVEQDDENFTTKNVDKPSFIMS